MASTPPTSSNSHGGPRGHESADVSPRGPFVFLLFLAVALAAIFAGLAGVDHLLAYLQESTARKQALELTPGVVPQGHPLPPEPRLESTGNAAITAVRQRDHNILTTYAWDDPSKTLARIPIQRAIDLVVAGGNGVPAALPANGLVVAPSATQPIGGAP
jgi:hypothetical protein